MIDMAKLTIHRKGHARKALPKKRGSKEGKKVKVAKTRVKPSTFKITDRGKPGRGSKVVPPLEEGALGGAGFFDRSNDEQEQIVFNRAKEAGEKKRSGGIRFFGGFFKKNQPP